MHAPPSDRLPSSPSFEARRTWAGQARRGAAIMGCGNVRLCGAQEDAQRGGDALHRCTSRGVASMAWVPAREPGRERLRSAGGAKRRRAMGWGTGGVVEGGVEGCRGRVAAVGRRGGGRSAVVEAAARLRRCRRPPPHLRPSPPLPPPPPPPLAPRPRARTCIGCGGCRLYEGGGVAPSASRARTASRRRPPGMA